jgi:predicted CopG family antitoxin
MFSNVLLMYYLECPQKRGSCDLMDYFTNYESEESEEGEEGKEGEDDIESTNEGNKGSGDEAEAEAEDN